MNRGSSSRRLFGSLCLALMIAAAFLVPATVRAEPRMPGQPTAVTGTPWAWGWNYRGQLGNGTIDPTASTAHYRASQVSLSMVTSIAGQFHGLAARQDGTAWAWGDNSHGQVGIGVASGPQPSPAMVLGLDGVTAIAAGAYHSVALKSDGTVWAWGWNIYGQLGDGTLAERHLPVQVAGLAGVTAISAGAYHSLALKSDGTVWAWGSNYYGELGDGSTIHQRTPIQVTTATGPLASIAAISAGGSHSLALMQDGTVWAWGWNKWGQVGNGVTAETGQPTAVRVVDLDNVTYISGGGVHSLAVKSDGTAWSWGNNRTGTLANGSVLDSAVPMQVVDTSGAPNYLTGVVAVAGGEYHSMALKADGTVWTWGENVYGELGDVVDSQTIWTSFRPLLVQGLTDVIAVAGSGFTPYALQRTARPPWDINGDHIVDIGDVAAIGLHWLETGAPGWIPEDANPDGLVDIGDVALVGMHWLETW